MSLMLTNIAYLVNFTIFWLANKFTSKQYLYVYVCWCDCVALEAVKSEMYGLFSQIRFIHTSKQKFQFQNKIIQTRLNNR